MTRRRWIADEIDGDRAALLGQNALHLARVLRARLGQEFDIASGDGVRIGRISSVNDDRVEFELGAEISSLAEKDISLLLAVFKFDRMEWAMEKAVELGVRQIIPVIAGRTDAHLAASAGKRVERWRRIAHEAAQQSRRASAPAVSEPCKLKDALAAVPSEGLRIVLAESEKLISLGQALESSPNMAVYLAVGPEGGWSEEELRFFADSGWTSSSLGATILRAETAAIAALAIVSQK